MSDRVKTRLATALRIASVAPIIALAAVLSMYFCADDIVAAPWQIAVVAACLTLLPLLAYPVQLLVPPLKEKGRDGQRTLAIVFSCAGYALLVVLAFALGFTPKLIVFALTYLFSGIALFVCRLFSLRPSGHCCGVAGPIAYLALFVSPYFAFAAFLLIAVIWACVVLKRHTVVQCIVGSIVPVVSLFVASAIMLL